MLLKKKHLSFFKSLPTFIIRDKIPFTDLLQQGRKDKSELFKYYT